MARRPERRLAAILAADVVGYSRMVRADEAGTLARIKVLRSEVFDPLTERHSGRLVKTMGDGVLIEFASAVDAVECALAVQRSLGRRGEDMPEDVRIRLRIGINLGDIVVDGDDIHGDGVNVAARLEGLCEPGAVFVSAAVRDQVSGKTEAAFEDLGEHTVKNIDAPVRVYRVSGAGGTAGAATVAPDRTEAAPGPERPSIAVLPFNNMSGDPEQDYFSDGITEDIITELSRFRSLFVIACNSSFAFRGQSVEIGEVARRLGVQYVVEGSVRKAGNRIRVTAQLIDAATGGHVWADRYDREMEDVFAVQDELTRAIVSILPGRLEEARRDRAGRTPTANLSAYDLVLAGNEHLKRHTREEIAEARRCYQDAVALDPGYARAHALLGWTHVCDASRGSWKDPCVDDALRSIEASLAIDDDESWSHGVYGQALIMRRRADEAEIHFKRAVALNPNDAEVAALWAPILVYMGRWREGMDWIDTAKRLNPYPGQWYHWYRGFALFSARDYDQSVTAIKELTPVHHRGYAYMAAGYGHLDRKEEARAALAGFEANWERERAAIGGHAPSSIGEVVRDWADRYSDPADGEHFMDGLCKAGWEG